MTRKMKCPVYGTERNFYRLAMLVDTSCDTEDDIVLGKIKDDANLLVNKSKDSHHPSTGILIKNTEIVEENIRKKSYQIFVLLKWCLKGDKIYKLQTNDLLAEHSNNGNVNIGTKSRRGISSSANGLINYKFNVSFPREAKCCQGWFDDVSDPNDISKILKIKKITTIKNMHAILNALKRVQCLVCHRETPGYDIPYSDLRVLERGGNILLGDNKVEKFLKKSKVLEVSVQLDLKFSNANQCKSENKFSLGICVECSKYYHIDNSNDIKPNKNYAKYVEQNIG